MLFGSQGDAVQPGWFVRSMKRGDIPRVLDIIREHDEEDAEWATKTYLNRGTDGHWVLTEKRRVAGVSGYILAEQTHAAYWISWTYLDKASQGQGLGTSLLEKVLAKLTEEIEELEQAASQDHKAEEFGDMLFVMTNLARHTNIDPSCP